MNTPTVLISILNWNKAEVTLECIESLRHMDRDGMTVQVMVLDNGSAPADYQKLRDGLHGDSVQLVRIEDNLGFTGGHNVSLMAALEQNVDYVWLLNNDATVQPDVLTKLVKAITADARCGAVSPVLGAEHGAKAVNAWGFIHEWKTRGRCWAQNAEASMALHQSDADLICLSGTAILLRVQAIREVGLLDERLFAYYDDNDICTRLSNGGWRNKVVFDAMATHESRPITKQPLYYFYLMYRNELYFWHTNMPAPYRKLLWLKIIDNALFSVNRLRRSGMQRQADCALLGVWDFICGKSGAPDIARDVPLAARVMCRMASYVQAKQLQAAEVRAQAAAQV